MSELNFFNLEENKPKVRVKRDALPFIEKIKPLDQGDLVAAENMQQHLGNQEPEELIPEEPIEGLEFVNNGVQQPQLLIAQQDDLYGEVQELPDDYGEASGDEGVVDIGNIEDDEVDVLDNVEGGQVPMQVDKEPDWMKASSSSRDETDYYGTDNAEEEGTVGEAETFELNVEGVGSGAELEGGMEAIEATEVVGEGAEEIESEFQGLENERGAVNLDVPQIQITLPTPPSASPVPSEESEALDMEEYAEQHGWLDLDSSGIRNYNQQQLRIYGERSRLPSYEEAVYSNAPPPTYGESIRNDAPPPYDEATEHYEAARSNAPPTYDNSSRDTTLEGSTNAQGLQEQEDINRMNEEVSSLEQEMAEFRNSSPCRLMKRSLDSTCEGRYTFEEEPEQVGLLEDEFQEAKVATEEVESVTSEIETSAMKITTELESEGVILAEEAEAGPPGWIADVITFTIFSCQIYDIVQGIRNNIELQAEKTNKMIEKISKAYEKIHDKIKFYEKEKSKINKEIKALKDQNNALHEEDALQIDKLEVQKLEAELDKIVDQQNSLVTELDLILRKEARLQDKIQGIGHHMEGAELVISNIIEKVKIGVEYYYDHAPFAKMTGEVLEDVCKCVNKATNYIIEKGEAVGRFIVNEINKDIIKPLTPAFKQVEEHVVKPVAQFVEEKIAQPIEEIMRPVIEPVAQFVAEELVQLAEKVAPVIQQVEKEILQPLEALLEEMIISNRLVKSLKHNFIKIDEQMKEGHEIIAVINNLIGQEHVIQQELEEKKEIILQHEKVALWIERHPEIQKEIQEKIIPKFACYKPIPKEILGMGERQPDILDPTCNPYAKLWFQQNPSALEIWLKHYPNDSKILEEPLEYYNSHLDKHFTTIDV